MYIMNGSMEIVSGAEMKKLEAFRIRGGSRVFTHELARRRSISLSRESRRYIWYGVSRGEDIVVPSVIKGSDFFERYRTMERRRSVCIRKSSSRPIFGNTGTSLRSAATGRRTGKSAGFAWRCCGW